MRRNKLEKRMKEVADELFEENIDNADISINGFIRQISTILNEYYYKWFAVADKEITCHFYTGQVFKLTVEELPRNNTL